jgi:hypothetical protein
MFRRIGYLAFALLALFGVARADKDALLDQMTGRWVLQGTIDGQQTTHDVDAEWILDGEYIRLHEVSREQTAQAKPRYEAVVLIGYDAAKSRYVCFWFDNTGIASPATGATAQRTGDTLPFIFKSAQGDFHTTFVHDANAGTWRWVMDGEQNGKLKPFARVKLTRR